MHMLSHLNELRRRLIWTAVTFLAAVAAAFTFVRPIYQWLSRDVEQKLVILGLTDVVWIYLLIAGVIGVAATIPVAAYQLWRFVAPALSPKERRAAIPYIPAFFLLFCAGISFGYWVIFPMLVSFLSEMAEDFETMYTAQKYFGFMVNMTVPFGFLFEMPVVVLFLTKIGLLNPKRLAKFRKLSYFLLSIVAVVLTPPDIVSDILVIIPLFLLFEISVTLSRLVYREQ
ncbi:MAG: tatC [Paenibacillus sp.]|nr:tatC [Paenibacillus sp.]